MGALRNTSDKNLISANALNLTRYSGVAAAIVALLTALGKTPLDKLLGGYASPAVHAELFIAVIAAWAVIAASDIVARAWATSASEAGRIQTLGTGIPATRTAGTDDPGWIAIAVRGGAGSPEFLIVKPANTPTWVAAADVDLGGVAQGPR